MTFVLVARVKSIKSAAAHPLSSKISKISKTKDKK
jgi:hypothetical protein